MYNVRYSLNHQQNQYGYKTRLEVSAQSSVILSRKSQPLRNNVAPRSYVGIFYTAKSEYFLRSCEDAPHPGASQIVSFSVNFPTSFAFVPLLFSRRNILRQHASKQTQEKQIWKRNSRFGMRQHCRYYAAGAVFRLRFLLEFRCRIDLIIEL